MYENEQEFNDALVLEPEDFLSFAERKAIREKQGLVPRTKKEKLSWLLEEYMDKFKDGFPMYCYGGFSYTTDEAIEIIEKALETGEVPDFPEVDYRPGCIY